MNEKEKILEILGSQPYTTYSPGKDLRKLSPTKASHLTISKFSLPIETSETPLRVANSPLKLIKSEQLFVKFDEDAFMEPTILTTRRD